MKKYKLAFIASAIGAVLAFLASALAFSLISELPLLTDDELSTTLITGGYRNAVTVTLAIVMPIILIALGALALFFYKKALSTHGTSDLLCPKNKRLSAAHVFIIIATAMAAASVVYLFVHRQTVWSHQIFSQGYDAYMDFFNHITYARYPEETYYQTHHACFPALAYIFYYVLSRILPLDATVKFNSGATSPYATLLLVFYTVVLCMILAYEVKKLLKQDGITSKVITLLLLISNFFVCVIERGNSAFIVLILLLGAMILRDSQKAWHREAALILIAIAAGFKIYPAAFGLLYLLEKRYKEAIRLVVYGILFFAIPFLFFDGLNGFKQFLENQKEVQDLDNVTLQSVKASVRYVADKITGDFKAFPNAEKILPLAFAAINLLGTLSKKTALWEKVFFICSIMVFFPAWSGSYTPIYFALPLLLFLREHKELFGSKAKIYPCIITAGFALTFSMILFVSPTGELFSNISYIALYAMDAIILVSVLCRVISPKLKAKQN